MKTTRPTRIEMQLWHAVKTMSGIVFARIEGEIERASGLSGTEFGVLSRLEDLGEGVLGQSELLASMHWQKSRLSHQLTRMERRKLIARTLCGRSVEVRMLKEGQKALQAARPAHARALQLYLTDRLTPEEKKLLLVVFEKLSA